MTGTNRVPGIPIILQVSTNYDQWEKYAYRASRGVMEFMAYRMQVELKMYPPKVSLSLLRRPYW